MKVSVVTVCYNAAATIGHTLSSFLEQAYPDKELVVVDGGSTDGTVELVETFKDPAIRIVSDADA